MKAATGLDQLASFLRARGLRTDPIAGTDLTIFNPVSASLTESVCCVSDSYVTGWGYEVGQVGDERSVAGRLAYLLGVPND